MRTFSICVLVDLAALFSVAGCAPPSPPVDVPSANGGTDDDARSSAGVSLFTRSDDCAQCHSVLTDEAGQDVSIHGHWRSTMMAHAALDPLFQAKLSAELLRNPQYATQLEAKCATCHTPMARTQAVADGDPVRLLGEAGVLDAEHPLHGLAVDGVSCAACHQIQGVGLGEEASFSGGYSIDLVARRPDRLIFGPYSEPVGEVMRSTVGFTPVESGHVRSSALCASCHTLFTPTFDAAGRQVGEFPEQVPYLEWLHSEFGDGAGADVSCQGCHMPAAAGGVVIANVPSGLAPRAPFGQHHFVGGNVFMLEMLRDHREALGVRATVDELEATIGRTLRQLQERTARLAVFEAGVVDGVIDIGFEIGNEAGHKLPTGYPSRRVWLHVVVVDSAGQVLFESGAPRADGSIVGHDGDESPGAFEPHYTSISSHEQVQVYEAVLADTDGAVTHTLLRAARYLKDNRLVPRGFDVATAGRDIAVAGLAAEDADFVGGADRVHYRIPVDGGAAPFTVAARLLFQSVAYNFVADLRATETPLVARFAEMYDDADHTPVVLATVVRVLEISR